jgi:hypothetical protein
MGDTHNWRNRIVATGMADPASLVPHPENYRKHGDGQRRAMGGALSELGWVQPITVNRTTGRIVDGHMRVGLAIKAGAEAVPVNYVELSEDEERLALATLDPLGDLAQRDSVAVHELIGTLTVSDSDLLAFLVEVDREAKKEVGGTVESRGAMNKEQGDRFERELGAQLEGEVVGWRGGKEDVSLEGWEIQAKSGSAFPERLWKWLTAIPMRPGKGRALVVADEPSPGAPRRAMIILELDRWRAAEGIKIKKEDER